MSIVSPQRLRMFPALGLALLLATLPADAASPDAPVLVTPADGATGVPAAAPLAVDVTDPDGDPLTVTFFGREAGQPAPDFTIVVLPDTQHYVDAGRPHFRAQTDWIVRNKDPMNVVYVAHVGDCVENGDFFDCTCSVDGEVVTRCPESAHSCAFFVGCCASTVAALQE